MDMDIRERLGIKKDRAQSLVLFTSIFFDDPPLSSSYMLASDQNETFASHEVLESPLLDNYDYDNRDYLIAIYVRSLCTI